MQVAAEGENTRNLSGKRTVDGGWAVYARPWLSGKSDRPVRAEGVSAKARVSQALDRGVRAHKSAFVNP